MYLNSYIKKFGKYTFEERPFNDVDAMALSAISMVSFDDYVKETGQVILKDIDFESIDKNIFYDSPVRKTNKEQLINMILSKRYQNLVVKNIRRIFSEKNVNQFYAITIVLPDGTLFLSFRGTDITLIGWKEDFILSIKDSILSQEQAEEYTNEVLANTTNMFYLGGHSKGGNIAFYSALHLKDEYLDRFIRAYSFDGPGFRNDMKLFPAYEKTIHKLTKYRTYNNLIGSMFNQMKQYSVVYSNGLLLGGHDLYYWQINPVTGRFKLSKDISPISKLYTKRFMEWVDSVSIEDRVLATESFFEIFKDCKTIYDLPSKAPKDILKMKQVIDNYPKEDRDRIFTIVKRLIKYLLTPIGNKKDK